MRRIALLIVVLLAAPLGRDALGAGYLAIVTGDVGDQSCTIVHNGQNEPCTKRKLYAGDELQLGKANLDSLKLVVHPAAEKVDLGDNRYAFKLAPVTEGEGLLKKIMSKFFDQEKHYAVNTVTRDFGDTCRRMSEFASKHPPVAAVILPKETVRLPLPPRTSKITIMTTDGNTVLITPASAKFDLQPADAGLEPGKDYVLSFDGSEGAKKMRLHVADEATEAQLTQAVKELAADSPEAGALQAAAYYQTLSDLHPETDYYFLSWQQLPEDMSALHDKDAGCNILARYVDTLSDVEPQTR